MWLFTPDALLDVRRPARLVGGFVESRDLGVLNVTTERLVVGGTYFPIRSRKPSTHRLSGKILETKDGWPWPDDLKAVVRQLIEAAVIAANDQNVVLTGIPARPDTDERFHHVLPGAAKALGVTYSNLLGFNRDVQSQIDANDRESNVANSMVSEPVESATVIVFDDIETTGSTLSEATRALKAAGAKSVVKVAIAKTAGKRNDPTAAFRSLREVRAKRPDWLTAQIAPAEPEKRRGGPPASRHRSPRPRPIRVPEGYVTAGEVQHRDIPRRPIAPPTMIAITLDLPTDHSAEAVAFLYEGDSGALLSLPKPVYRRIGTPDRITAQLANEGFCWEMEPGRAAFMVGWLTESDTVLKPIPQSGYELDLLVPSSDLERLQVLGRVKLRLVCENL